MFSRGQQNRHGRRGAYYFTPPVSLLNKPFPPLRSTSPPQQKHAKRAWRATSPPTAMEATDGHGASPLSTAARDRGGGASVGARRLKSARTIENTVQWHLELIPADRRRSGHCCGRPGGKPHLGHRRDAWPETEGLLRRKRQKIHVEHAPKHTTTSAFF